MRKKEIDFEARRARVKEVCAKYDSENRWRETDQGSYFWFDMEHGFAFCAHAKVCSFTERRFPPQNTKSKRRVTLTVYSFHCKGWIFIVEEKPFDAVKFVPRA